MTRAVSRARLGVCLLTPLVLLAWVLAPAGTLAAAEPHVTAQHAVVIDADSGQVLFNKDMDTPAAPASLTKIFTAAVALSSAALNQTLTVDSYDLVGESSMGLTAGQHITLRTALYGMLLPSGNDAAVTIAQNLGALPGDTPQQSIDRFMERVNTTATRLGLQHTHLVNPHGLDAPGHVTTARDLAAITMFALRNDTFRTIIGTAHYSAEGFDLYQSNRLLGSYKGLIGGKTGITDNAGYCLVEVAQRGGHTVIAVVLKDTADAWYGDASALLDYGFDTLAAGAPLTGLPVISLAPAPPQVQQPVVNQPAPENTGLRVQQLSEREAVVAHPSRAAIQRLSWRWPLAAAVMMLLATLLALNYHLLFAVAGMAWHHRPRRSARPKGPARRHRTMRRHAASPRPPRAPVRRKEPTTLHRLLAATEPLSVTPARTGRGRDQSDRFTSRGIALARRGDYPGATAQFQRALELDPVCDLARADGFWSMDPCGYLAAARAYARLDRLSDARSLLTIVRLGCGSQQELEGLLHEVVAASR